MLKKTIKPLALILALILVISATLIPTSILASAATEDIDYSLFTGRHTWKFDTDAANENFQPNMKDSTVDTVNGYFKVPTDWTQTQPVNYEFKSGKTYVVNIKWKVSAKPSGGFQFQLRAGDTAFKNYGWMSSVPTDWQTDRIQFTAANTGLLKIYMNAGVGETLYIDTISVYEVGSSVRFDFSDDTQIKALYNDNVAEQAQLTENGTFKTDVTKQWTTNNQFVPDYVIENGKKYTVTFKYKANKTLSGNTFVVNYNKGTGAWNAYHSNAGFVSPSINTTSADAWYNGEFTFVAENDSAYPYIGFLMRPTKVATYEFDDITICQTSGTVNLNLGDSTETANTFGLKTGDSYTLPSATKVGYTLEGWYLEPEFKTAVTKVNVPAEGSSITVYAKWKKAISYFLDFNKSSDLELGASWNGDCVPKINNNELHLRGSANTNPSYARLPILLEAGTYNYSFKYRANPVNADDTYTLFLFAGSNTATDMNSINSGFASAKAVRLFNAAKLSTGEEYVTKTGTFVITEEMISEGSDRLTLRISSKTRYDELYIDDLYIEKAISGNFDFADASQVGSTYSASVTNGAVEMSADAGKQSRVRLNYELKAGSYYTLTYKYRAESALDIKLAPWYAKASSGWDFLGGDNEFSYIIPGAFADYEYATTEWKTVTLNFVATGNINENYKYLGFWMQSSLDGGKIYIDDVVITERAAKVSFETNGGNAIDDLTYLPIAESVTLATPIKENYKFVGWYYDADCTQVVGSTYAPYAGEDVVLYAKWEAKTINGTIPSVPNVSYENGKVTVDIANGYEYKVGDSAWQKSNEFADLIVGPQYTFYQRIAETDTHSTSSVSEGKVFSLSPNGDYNRDGRLDSMDLVGVRKYLLNVETIDSNLVGGDSNEDGIFDIRDLVRLKKLLVSKSYLFIGNTDISNYSIVDNCRSFVSAKASELLKNSVEDYSGVSLAETSDKNIIFNVTYQDEDNYTISVVDGNLVFEANSDYMLLEAVNAFASKYDSLTDVRVHIPRSFVMSNNIFENNSSYTLTWNDEFNGDSLDKTKWMNNVYSEEGGSFWEGGYATVQRTANAVEVSDGSLKLNTFSDGKLFKTTWYGADIRTTNKFNFSRGYIEVRAKLPGTGNWAAFWLNGKRDENFLISNEVDVFEVFGNTDKITSTIYAWTGNEATNRKVIEADTTLTEDILNEYHTYGCELTDTGVTIYVDGVVVTNVLFENCEADAVSYLKNGGAMDILLGNSTGYDKINEFNFIQGEPTASTFEIDYIRLYK